MATLNKQIVLNCEKLERRMAELNSGKLELYEVERENNDPKPGNIYLGKIVNLEPALQAAFVDIGCGKNAFLHYREMLPGGDDLLERREESESIKREKGKSGRRGMPGSSRTEAEATLRRRKLTVADIPEVFRPGMELLVQVVKSPIGTKGARVTTDISIAGRYLVLMPFADHIGLSTRIESAQERERLRKILAGLEVPDGMGLICRTIGEGRKAAFFKHDLELLLDYWQNITEVLEKQRAPCLAYAEPGLIERTIRDFITDDIGGIVVDDHEAWMKISGTLRRIGGRKMAAKVSWYKDAVPVFEHYRINDQLRDVYRREVRLPGGGWICIDETEALIAIDVNSGHGRKSAEQPDFILKTNLEAAEEIARQLRLRDIGGLVVLDFIDMRSAKDRDEVFRTMKKLVKDDRAKTKVLPLSRLGLMEMTRQREHESLLDQSFSPCPYCDGSGRVKSAMTMSVEIQRRLNAVLRERRYRGVPVRVIMHPDVLARLRNEDARLLDDIEEKYRNTLSFRADPAMHYEDFKIVDSDTGTELK